MYVAVGGRRAGAAFAEVKEGRHHNGRRPCETATYADPARCSHAVFKKTYCTQNPIVK